MEVGILEKSRRLRIARISVDMNLLLNFCSRPFAGLVCGMARRAAGKGGGSWELSGGLLPIALPVGLAALDAV
jgi:hypothetical protein